MSAIPIGPTPVLSKERKGELLFHDASECFQNWLSCATCHPDGRMDSLNWDLLDDGLGNPKNGKSLVMAHATGPSLWLGLHDDLDTAVHERFRHQLFCAADRERRDWVAAYLESLEPVPSPLLVDGRLSERAKRGKTLFESPRVGCATCHPAPLYTDRKLHDVGTKGRYDRHEQFDTPTLVECWRSYPYLHDGRYLTVKELLSKGNHGDANDKLSGEELDAVTAFVLSL
jgi:cytochrome c peroxidase